MYGLLEIHTKHTCNTLQTNPERADQYTAANAIYAIIYTCQVETLYISIFVHIIFLRHYILYALCSVNKSESRFEEVHLRFTNISIGTF